MAPTEPLRRRAGVVDCGTNSTRLLITDQAGRVFERRMVITRMGEGVDRTRRLSEAAMERTLGVLADYGERLANHGVDLRRAVATSAARDAANREGFFDRAQTVLGVRPELLSGMEEGRLSFAGATAGASLAPGQWVLVFDIGGGSTELVLGRSGSEGEARTVTLDVGCVRLTERFLASDPPTRAELEAATAQLDGDIRWALTALGWDGVAPARPQLLGLAGTVSTAALVDAGARQYDRQVVHHRNLPVTTVVSIFDRLAVLPHSERGAVPGLEPGRVDVIVGGLLILARILALTGAPGFLASESDILDGMAAELLRRG